MLPLWRRGCKQGEVAHCNAGDLCGFAAMWLLIDTCAVSSGVTQRPGQRRTSFELCAGTHDRTMPVAFITRMTRVYAACQHTGTLGSAHIAYAAWLRLPAGV